MSVKMKLILSEYLKTHDPNERDLTENKRPPAHQIMYDLGQEHLAVEELYQYAYNSDKLASVTLQFIENHLSTCSECKEAVRLLKHTYNG